MYRLSVAIALSTLLTSVASAELPKPMIEGLKSPESVVIGSDGRIYITEIGEFGKDGDGRVSVIKDGKAETLIPNLDDPKGITQWQGTLFVTDKTRVLKVGKDGKATVFADAKAFPTPPLFLNDIEADLESGMLYVSDSGDLKGKEGAVYRIDQKGKVTLVIDGKKSEAIKTPNGLLMDGQSHLLILDFASGELHRLKLSTGTMEKLADGFGGGDGLIWDKFGRLFISDWKGGKVFVIPRPGEKPILLAEGFKAAADMCLSRDGKSILVPDMTTGTLTAISTQVPGAKVDDTPFALQPETAFPNIKWSGWEAVDNAGKPKALRPIVLTHAGDGSNRIFLATQHGVIYSFADDREVKTTNVYMDIESRVFYADNENEQGFLGMAFHPQYKKNGEFFYTDKKKKTDNVLSRFKASKSDPNKADPDSEEELLRISRPFWNHDGGTICFGQDGYLYVTLGDGGSANDPMGNGQNMKSILGKTLRLDIDKKGEGTKYGIPKDNPFVGQKDVRPEIWCSGLRNIWRMSFDRKTGKLWAGEVGQNLYEEINILEKGGNYGWNLRESLHPFGAKGVRENKEMIDPIWEYHHDIGKSITGGHVYRGKRLPELEGHYVYADYVSGRIWALKYDEEKKRVVANRPIKDMTHPVLSFGEDEKGELYYLIATPTGQGIYHFASIGKK